MFLARRCVCSGTFSKFRLTDNLVRCLENVGITKPTEIQEKSIPLILDRKHTVINAETGSGKTLCYLLPFVEHLRNQTLQPYRSLVLVPNQELAHQVVSVFDSLSDSHDYKACAVSGSNSLTLHSNVAAIVSTPASLANYSWPVILKHVRYTVLDEADLLLSGSAQKLTWKILDYLMRNDPKQFVFCGATLPAKGKMATQSLIERWLKRNNLLENSSFVASRGAHRLVRGLDVEFVPVSSIESKFENLLAFLSEERSKIIVFTNTVATCTDLYSTLVDRLTQRKLGRLDKTVSSEMRSKTLREFARGKLDVLVCTDLASRGFDIPNVETVIQYDFPENSTAFLHRAGRTARAERKGKVISFVLSNETALADLVESACLNGNDASTFERIFSRKRALRKRLGVKQGAAK